MHAFTAGTIKGVCMYAGVCACMSVCGCVFCTYILLRINKIFLFDVQVPYSSNQ